MEPPPLSPLALDGSSRLDGWDVEEDLDIDLENLFDDAEGIVHNFGNQGQEQGQEPQPQQQQQSAGNVGVNGDIASIGNYTVGLLSPSEVTSGEEANTLFPNSSANINSAVVERGDEPHAIAAPTTPGPSTTATTWSTASASEDSDDCSRSTTSGNSCNFGVNSPASSSILARDMMTSSDRSSSSSSSATDTPRSITSEASTVNNDNTAVTDNHNRKRLLAVSSSARTPILPFTFAPAFGGGGGSGSSSPSLAHFGGLQAAALAAASGAAGQALAAGWKRLRGGDDGGPGACGQASSAGSVGGAGTGAAPSRLLCGGGDGGSSAGHGRINKRAKREERLMKNREAANRSRVKRKEVLSELENRVDVLSSSLATSREETAALAQEIASLREQNSFLRGMLSVQGNAIDLPPVLPTFTTTSRGRPCHEGGAVERYTGGGGSGSGGGRGASAAAAGASAVLGAVGMGLAVVSCVALSAAGFGGMSADRGDLGSRMGHGNGGVEAGHSAYTSRGGSGGGRRMLLAVDDCDYYPSDEEAINYLGVGSVGGYVILGVAISLAWVLVFAVARWTYREAVAHQSVSGGRGSRGRRDGGAHRGKGAAFGYLRGVWPLGRSLGSDPPILKHVIS